LALVSVRLARLLRDRLCVKPSGPFVFAAVPLILNALARAAEMGLGLTERGQRELLEARAAGGRGMDREPGARSRSTKQWPQTGRWGGADYHGARFDERGQPWLL